MTPEMLVLLGRVVERTAAWLLAALLLFFAYRLACSRRQLPTQTAEFKWNELLIKLAKISPGVFFAILGTAIVITNFRSPLELSFSTTANKTSTEATTPELTRQIRYSDGTAAVSIVDVCVTINRLDLLVSTLKTKETGDTVTEMLRLSQRLMQYRDGLLTLVFGRASVSHFREKYESYQRDPQSVASNEIPTLEALQKAFHSTDTSQ